MIEIGREYIISTNKTELHPRFYEILGERVIVTGEEYIGKYPVKFVDNPNLNNVAQRVRGDLLYGIKEKSNNDEGNGFSG